MTSIALIAGAGVFLGLIGSLGLAGFLVVHGVVLAGLALADNGGRPAGLPAWRSAGLRLREGLSSREPAHVWAKVLALVLLVFLLLASQAEPAVFDALTYRLPRIGDWLQTGRIRILETSDPRLNYMPVVPDLFMAWLMSGFSSGYAGLVVAQALGGALLALGTIGIARHSGLGRSAAVMTAFLLFGMANVVPQYTSAHTDLFTAGVFVAAFHLWLCNLQRREGSVLGGWGAGLALGSKGTIFYLAPGALIWVVWLGFTHRLAWAQWRRTALAGVLGAGVFAGPVFWRNWQAYGSILGPRDYVEMHHRPIASTLELARKLGNNLATSAVQLLDPNSQPGPIQAAARSTALALTNLLPPRDADMFEQRGRHATLREIFERGSPDADVTSFGLVAVVLFLFGIGIAVRDRARPPARLILIWSGGVVAFLGFFHAMQQWHPYGYRYFVLVAPWIAVVAAWGLEQLGRSVRLVGWGVALASAVAVGWQVTTHTHQVGWQAIVRPERSRGYFVFQQWRTWATALSSPTHTLTVALPPNLPIAAFFRLTGRPIALRPEPSAAVASAEDLTKQETGWVVVRAGQFLGREGRVCAQTWLFRGDPESPFSVAAYRRLQPGEESPPVLYRAQDRTAAGVTQHDLLIKTWTPEPVRLRLANVSQYSCHYVVNTPSGRSTGDLGPGREILLAIVLPAGLVSEVKVTVIPAVTDPAAGRISTIELRP